MSATPCTHTDAHHAVAGEPELYGCDECGTTWTEPAQLLTGDTVTYSGPTADLDGKTGVVVGRWTEDESVIDVEIDGTRWSIPADRLTRTSATSTPASTPYLPDTPGYEWVIDADGEPIDVREVIDAGEPEPVGALTGEPGMPPRGASSQAGLSAVRYARLRNPKISSGGAVTTASPAPSDDSTPSLVQLDQDDAAQRLAAVVTDHLSVVLAAGLHETTDALRAALADFRAVSGR